MELVFISVLRKLGYRGQIADQDRCRVVIAHEEARQLICKYLEEMTSGVRFDYAIISDINRSSPEEILVENISAANLVNARFSARDAEHLVGRTIRALQCIPLDADLFTDGRWIHDAATAVSEVDDSPGAAAAVATKILHQKRPGYIPIFDDLARRALNVPWIKGEGPQSYIPLFEAVRRFANVDGNLDTLNSLTNWVNSETLHGQSCTLSRLRVLDILAWSLIYYRNPF